MDINEQLWDPEGLITGSLEFLRSILFPLLSFSPYSR